MQFFIGDTRSRPTSKDDLFVEVYSSPSLRESSSVSDLSLTSTRETSNPRKHAANKGGDMEGKHRHFPEEWPCLPAEDSISKSRYTSLEGKGNSWKVVNSKKSHVAEHPRSSLESSSSSACVDDVNLKTTTPREILQTTTAGNTRQISQTSTVLAHCNLTSTLH